MNFLDMDLPQFVALSPQDLRANPEYALATRLDYRKVPRILAKEWPKAIPEAHFLGEDAKADAWWLRMALRDSYCTVDVETERLTDGTYNGRIIQIGFCTSSRSVAIWDRVLYPDFPFVPFFRKLIS